MSDITRPKGARDKRVRPGMTLYEGPAGGVVAAYRRGKTLGRKLGTIVSWMGAGRTEVVVYPVKAAVAV